MSLEKEKSAIEILKTFEPEEGYRLAYSGGKDSDCIKILAQIAGVKFEAVHNLTTVDAPETVQYIKSQNDVKIHKARYKDGSHITMWNLIVKKRMPPTRLVRYCCSSLKESGGQGQLLITGVRWAESSGRKEHSGIVSFIGKPKDTLKTAEEMSANYRVTKQGGVVLNDDNDESRRMVEQCYRTRKTLVNPIVDWTDADVWEFLNHYGCKCNPLYSEGFNRIGCIGCPMAGVVTQRKELERYPKYKEAYIRAFDKMVKKRIEDGLKTEWTNGQEVLDWWIGEPKAIIDEAQITIEDFEL